MSEGTIHDTMEHLSTTADGCRLLALYVLTFFVCGTITAAIVVLVIWAITKHFGG